MSTALFRLRYFTFYNAFLKKSAAFVKECFIKYTITNWRLSDLLICWRYLNFFFSYHGLHHLACSDCPTSSESMKSNPETAVTHAGLQPAMLVIEQFRAIRALEPVKFEVWGYVRWGNVGLYITLQSCVRISENDFVHWKVLMWLR